MRWNQTAGVLLGLAVAMGYGSNADGAVLLVNANDFPSPTEMGSAVPGLTFSTVPVTGSYIGTSVVSSMVQTGPAIGGVTADGRDFPDGSKFLSVDAGVFGLVFDIDNALRVDFLPGATYVSVRFVPNDNDTGVLQAYGAADTLLAEFVARSRSVFELEYTALSEPVRYLLATFGDTGYIDQVGYELAAVPAPGVLGLLLTGLLAGAVAQARGSGSRTT